MIGSAANKGAGMTTQVNDHVQMTVPEILKGLELCTGVFPKRAVQQAIEQQEAITPHLLGVLEELAASPASFVERDDYMLHIFAMYLLAQFREKRAYRPLVTIISAPGDIPDRLSLTASSFGTKLALISPSKPCVSTDALENLWTTLSRPPKKFE